MEMFNNFSIIPQNLERSLFFTKLLRWTCFTSILKEGQIIVCSKDSESVPKNGNHSNENEQV